MTWPKVQLALPGWLRPLLPPAEHVFHSIEERMQLAIRLAAANIEHDGGGPFGAAVFDLDSGRLLAPGVNLVTSACCSVAHAELVALMTAQRLVGHFSLAAAGLNAQLVSSTEPCAMCLGALPWAGLRSLACGARDADARAIGFDEGDKPEHWQDALERRGIAVLRDVCRAEAVAVLERYRDSGGLIYNGRHP
ncbi:nucleoside deaminase [Desulfuromonas sp. CSMB_57]|jgi:tRNA(Arg) A34 adenosine deaminase TadA|uniref:nucleoside deaminase n=1 Tax=Desulfuromonas sp. CSMB_57 TaxID=2807629 RepID=UPI001CD7AC63|nr:nucleoside deaminase [Desulfuromonas sp. CSMB_57]